MELMASHEWRFQLDGDEYHVNTIIELFLPEVIILSKDGEPACLIMRQGTSNMEEVVSAATELLAKLNAIAYTIYPNHENVRLGRVTCYDEAGRPMNQVIQPAGIPSRARVSNGNVGAHYLPAAETVPELDRALYIFGSLPHEWRSLYVVLEVIRGAHKDDDFLKGWGKRIDAFKATAGSYRAIGIHARHGDLGGALQPQMTLQEANDLIRTLLERWIRQAVQREQKQ
jgi:hypothetical protein